MSYSPVLPSPVLRVRRDSARLLSPFLWRWFAVGAIACLLSPALRGYNVYIGWLPFWLVAAPVVVLALLHRARLAAALSASLVGRRRRHGFFADVQARRARRSRMLSRPLRPSG